MGETVYISSQRYLDDSIVEAKRAAKDYTVSVSPEFNIGGMSVRVVRDGHHSFAAARADGVAPKFVTVSSAHDDTLAVLEESGAEAFLERVHDGDDWYDIATGQLVF